MNSYVTMRDAYDVGLIMLGVGILGGVIIGFYLARRAKPKKGDGK